MTEKDLAELEELASDAPKKPTGMIGHLDNGKTALSFAVMALMEAGLLVPVKDDKKPDDDMPAKLWREKP